MSDTPHTVRVNILGQEYSIRTTADKKYIDSVAEYVNFRMKEIMESAPDITSQLRIAVLAAMNITDELFTEQASKENIVNRLEAKTLAIREYVDEKISESEKQ